LVLPAIEVVFDKVPDGKPKINLFVPDDTVMEWVRRSGKAAQVRESNHSSVCPAELEPHLRQRLEATALRAYRALGCRDWCRMEFRVDAKGDAYLLELNPIAGIDPSYHFPRSARAAGLSYAALLHEILMAAAARQGL
jgi:D-alanine-D-alanine ligase